MCRWVLVSVTSAGAGALRMHVWRKLRSLGALYLQQSVCVLPARPAVMKEVSRLVDRVRRQGGAARVLRMEFTDAGDRAAVVDDFNAARNLEYAELMERIPTLRQELADERGRGRATYAEVEESEADLDRFQVWLTKIAARDYFAASGGAAARAAVDEAAADFAGFEQAALAAELPGSAEPARSTGLRVVKGS